MSPPGLVFGIAKFQLAQTEVKLVGELVDRDGRKPNPDMVRCIKQWPPVRTLKDLQSFLGTMNFIRPHMPPNTAHIMNPLRVLLKPGAKFPPTAEQEKAIQQIKDAVTSSHIRLIGTLCTHCCIEHNDPGDLNISITRRILSMEQPNIFRYVSGG